MGGICSKNVTTTVTSPSSNNSQNQMLNAQYGELLNFESPSNINHKYSHKFVIMPTNFFGEGILRSWHYKSLVTMEELAKARDEFWETRVEGNPNTWNSLKLACTLDEANAKAILLAAGITMVKNSIQLCFDEQFNKYELPVFVIHEPITFDVKKDNPPQTINFPVAKVSIKMRCTEATHDVEFSVENTILIEQLKEKYLEEAKIEKKGSMRLFFSGRELKDGHYLGEFNIQSELVVQVFMKSTG